MQGTEFGRYRLIEVLGRGGMGEVWRAYDTGTDRIVAIKVLPTGLATDPQFERRFRREAHAAASLHHPHIVPIHDYGEIDGRLFVAMALIEGRDLQAVLIGGPLAPDRAVRVIGQVALALQAAHNAGLVHRDVKPSNILVDSQDFAYLIDFGIAHAAGETVLTGTGATIGTWAYMSPERFQDGTADTRADIYALTCVLYQTLTGQPPFPATRLEQIAAAHMFAAPPKPSQLTAVTPAMDQVVAIGMAKQPGDRYQTTSDLARAAAEAVTSPVPRAEVFASMPTQRAPFASPPDPSPRQPNREPNPMLVRAAGLLLVTAAALGCVLVFRERAISANSPLDPGLYPNWTYSLIFDGPGPWYVIQWLLIAGAFVVAALYCGSLEGARAAKWFCWAAVVVSVLLASAIVVPSGAARTLSDGTTIRWMPLHVVAYAAAPVFFGLIAVIGVELARTVKVPALNFSIVVGALGLIGVTGPVWLSLSNWHRFGLWIGCGWPAALLVFGLILAFTTPRITQSL